MTFDDVLASWEEDSKIDESNLSVESLKTPQLHGKYLTYLMGIKRELVDKKKELNELRVNKFRYYRGEMSKEELTALGWPQWQGVKPIKSEMDEFLKGDKDLNDLNLKIERRETYVYMLESILSQIKARDWQIRNAIEFTKFLAGQ